MGWWKAERQDSSDRSSTPPSKAQPHPPSGSRSKTDSSSGSTQVAASSCPVDPRAREIWLQQSLASQRHIDRAPPPPKTNRESPGDAFARSSTAQCSSDTISQSPAAGPSQTQMRPGTTSSSSKHAQSLSHDRAISSIPRAFPHNNNNNNNNDDSTESPGKARPSNSEAETGAHASGHWIYPSQHQFFTAVMRKHDPNALIPSNSKSSSGSKSNSNPFPLTKPPADNDDDNDRSSSSSSSATEALAATMPTIIPIHNAVNERAWSLIRAWENPHNQASASASASASTPPPTQASSKSSGSSKAPPPSTAPHLLSFHGLGSGPPPSSPQSGLPGLLSDYLTLLDPTTPLSPRARWNGFRGYQIPFDRHDWRVRRSDGGEVDYVIDFYQGRSGRTSRQKGGEEGGGEKMNSNLNFYLDVRPKLNSWLGVRTRFLAGWWRVVGGGGAEGG